MFFFFFFQAEDGIRDIGVTGVQTCALPISLRWNQVVPAPRNHQLVWQTQHTIGNRIATMMIVEQPCVDVAFTQGGLNGWRSEERRVGKEWRSRWSPYH